MRFHPNTGDLFLNLASPDFESIAPFDERTDFAINGFDYNQTFS